MVQVDRLKKPGVSIEGKSIRDDIAVFVDVEALRSALVGVILFVQQLIDGPGTITVSVESEYISAANLKNPRATPDSFVVIEVRSSAAEIREADRIEALSSLRIRDEELKPLGLALAVAHGVTQAHGGWLTVESKRGAGASIALFIPRVHTQ
jgi:light-regulated signal transduction histidine kinase (bacteriophytochrome)